MREIRYFGRLVDPAEYRRGFGFWGWLASVLNVLRVWLEKQTVLAVLRLECRRAGLTRLEIKSVVRQAANHPDFVPVLDTSLPRFVRKLMRDAAPILHLSAEDRTRARYSEGRKNGDDTPKMRPEPLEDGMKITFSRFMARTDRSARYVPGRRFFIDYGDHTTAVPSSRRSRRNQMNQKIEQQNQAQVEQGQPLPEQPLPAQKPGLGEQFAHGANTRHLRDVRGLERGPKK